MVAQEPATLLAVLIANSERTYEETVEEYLRCARQNREKATLSARTLQRWAKGRVVTTPRPSQRRVAKLYWGYPMATLLAPPPADGKIPPPESNVNDGRTAPPAAGHPQPPDAGRAHPTAHAGEDSKEEDVMQRRTVLRALAGLATLTTPAFTTEGPRSDTGPDEWESIAATYATLYYALPPAELINRLGAEMAALEHKAAGKDQTSLCRVAAQLSAVMALALVASHRLPLARRWWVTAHRYADQSGDLDTRLWVSDWEVVSGTYERRPVGQIIDLADQAITLGGDHVCCGSAGVWAGRAQALALAGNTKEAISALHKTAEHTERMPAAVIADNISVFGWPEVRLRHTESYVYTHLGLTDQAMAAQDRALAIYPTELSRERAQLELHRAKCHILRGDITDGLTYAADVLDDLPVEQHNARLHEVGRQVIRAVPATERRRPEYDELRERLLALRASLDPR